MWVDTPALCGLRKSNNRPPPIATIDPAPLRDCGGKAAGDTLSALGAIRGFLIHPGTLHFLSFSILCTSSQ